MKAKIIGLGACLFMLTSCSSVRHTSTTAPVETRVVNFTVADMEVNKTKAEKTYSWNYNPLKRVSISTVKTNTEAELLKECGGDVLVEPQYIVKRRGFLRGGSVTVIGFPAKYTNFRKMSPAEAELIKVADHKKKKTKKRWFIF
ncbi:MAG: hypothetical protein K2I26_02815 [Paramuribaculum sp.]|nr:hypothetical protein [Paramuribaculum sp.]